MAELLAFVRRENKPNLRATDKVVNLLPNGCCRTGEKKEADELLAFGLTKLLVWCGLTDQKRPSEWVRRLFESLDVKKLLASHPSAGK